MNFFFYKYFQIGYVPFQIFSNSQQKCHVSKDAAMYLLGKLHSIPMLAAINYQITNLYIIRNRWCDIIWYLSQCFYIFYCPRKITLISPWQKYCFFFIEHLSTRVPHPKALHLYIPIKHKPQKRESPYILVVTVVLMAFDYLWK